MPSQALFPERRLARRWRAVVLCGALAAGGCAGPGTKPVSEAPHTVRKLPAVPLTPELVYDILLGEIARQRGHPQIAAEAMMRAALASRDPRLVERATRLAVLAKRREDAIRAARLWTELEPDRPLPRETLGALLAFAGQPAAARAELEKALALHGDDLAGAYRRIGKILRQVPDRPAAIRLLRHLVAQHPEVPAGHLALARLAGVRNLAQALPAVDRALALRPDWEEAALFKAQLFLAAKRADDFKRFCTAYLEEYPEARRVRLQYARALLDQGAHEAAREQFDVIVAQDPDDVDARFAVGLLSIQVGDLDAAERHLKRVLALNPRNDQARLYLGQLAYERKDYEQALEWYRQVRAEELRFEVHLRAANAMAASGDVDGALAYLGQVRPANDAQRVQWTIAREEILREAGRLAEAMAMLNRRLREMPEDKDLLYTRGVLAAEMGQLALHEADMRRLLAQDPNNAQALNALGYTLADRTDRYEEAYELIKRALALRPADPFILDSMGWVEYRLGRLDSALTYLKKAWAKRKDPEIGAHLGEVLWQLGRRDEARRIWDQARQRDPDNEVLSKTLERFLP